MQAPTNKPPLLLPQSRGAFVCKALINQEFRRSDEIIKTFCLFSSFRLDAIHAHIPTAAQMCLGVDAAHFYPHQVGTLKATGSAMLNPP